MKRIVNALGKLNCGKRVYAGLVLFAITPIALPAQTFTTLFSFDITDGEYPTAGLVQATDGNLYGTTSDGGANGGGTVFKITPSGTLTSIYSFCFPSQCTDGSAPYAGLVQAGNGAFYGTTQLGGANSQGTVFEITPSGKLTTLYSFCSQSGCADGQNPTAGLARAANGDFYGTTYGSELDGPNYNGTVFKITPTGTLTTFLSFNGSDGLNPYAGLVQGTDGSFYGTTYQGGANGDGTIFKITQSGTLMTLYSFCSQSGCTDGQYPYAGLIQATNGDFYGTTYQGGANGFGTIFKITPSGTLMTLYSFCSKSGCADGQFPVAGLVQATDGNFYGTTEFGGANDTCFELPGCGTIFKITPAGTLTTLYSFCTQIRCADGEGPLAGLVQATNGGLYGTTSGGGTLGEGTVFSLSVGLGPFVETRPTSGKMGKVVEILGNDLTGATSVSFNGIAAVFKVDSGSLIMAAVPAGATTGFVTVTTPAGTLKSNVKFRIRQ